MQGGEMALGNIRSGSSSRSYSPLGLEVDAPVSFSQAVAYRE